MKKAKRLIAAILSLALLSSMVGCSSTPADTDTSTSTSTDDTSTDSSSSAEDTELDFSENITLSVFGSKSAMHGDWDEMEYWDILSEKFNVTFEFEAVEAASYAEKLALKMASSILPDILLPADLTASNEVQYASEGILVPLNDYIDTYCENIQTAFETYDGLEKSLTHDDGNIYTLFDLMEQPSSYVVKTWINGDWLDALGVTELPETLDELTELMFRFRDEDPNGNGEADEIPIRSYSGTATMQYFVACFGMVGSDVEEVDGVVRYNPATDNYKAYLEYMNYLYSEEILDPNMFSLTVTQANTKEMGIADGGTTPTLWGDEDSSNPILSPVTSEWCDEPLVTGLSNYTRGTFAMTYANEYPERTMAMIDWLYSEEGSLMSHYGVEGTYWTYDDDSETTRTIVEDATEELRGSITIGCGESIPKITTIEIEESFQSEFINFRNSEAEEKLIDYAKLAMPLLYLTQDEQDEIAIYYADISAYVQLMRAKFITGEESFDNWDSFVQELYNMGLQEYIDVYQGAIDRYYS